MILQGDGKVGIGTTSPGSGYALDVVGSIHASVAVTADSSLSAGYGTMMTMPNNDVKLYHSAPGAPMIFELRNTTNGDQFEVMRLIQGPPGWGGRVGIGTTTPAEKLHVGGNILATGTITPGSSRTLKERIRDLAVTDAVAAVHALKPTRFYYKADKADEHLGFIAEDVPALLATKDRKGVDPMDIAAVLTKVVQQQQQQLGIQGKQLEAQKKAFTAQIEELKKQVQQLRRRGG